MKRLGQWLGLLVVLAIGAIGVAFAVANRQIVAIHFDPFVARASEQIEVELPLFIVLIVMLALGVVLGSLFTWFSQGKHRRALRTSRSEMARLRTDYERKKS
ncbi:MAG TPA: LapA family protein [Methylovirgula sp.]|jgi:uncharacterized membrane protein YciS (DUF1049 family)|nr:LapA family protein [Methylovirgula sp.]